MTAVGHRSAAARGRQLSYREASWALRVREGTVTTRLHRARQRVADMLTDGDGIRPAVRSPCPEATKG